MEFAFIVSQFTEALRRIKGVLPSSHYVLLALLLVAGLEIITAFHRWITLTVTIFIGLLVVGIVLLRSEERGEFHPIQSLLPILTATGITAFVLFLPATPLLHLYITLAGLLFFLVLRHGARRAYPTWNWVLSTVALFLNASALLGWQFQVAFPVLVLLMLLFLIAFLITLQALARLDIPLSESVLLALVLSLVMCELAWTLQFLSLHYVVQAGMLVTGFYVGFHLLALSYQRGLTIRDILEYGSMGVFASAILLTTAQWL